MDVTTQPYVDSQGTRAGLPWDVNPLVAPDPAALQHQRARRRRWDAVARLDRWNTWARTYHRRLARVYSLLVPPGTRVLEIGCGRGNLLAAVRPAHGVGVDFSREMLRHAQATHPHLHFVEADAHDFHLDQTFDYVILSDLLNDVWNVQAIFNQVRRHCTPGTRVLVNSYSRLWELPLGLTERLGLAKPVLQQNWLTAQDIRNLFHLSGFEVLRSWPEVLLPLGIPLLASLCNRVLVRIPPFTWLALTNFLVARPADRGAPRTSEPRVTVVVPARNEAGNIKSILARVPELGGGTELLFVEGNSTDDTRATIAREIPNHPHRDCRLLTQPGRGKGDAVRTAFDAARGDILMILDADLTVAPEDLPLFYAALRENKGEFVNGVRMVYPMDARAMRFFNLLGNKFFSWAFTWLLGQPVRDTLCGTKVLWRRDYEAIAANRAFFGDFDPFGDFDLLFGAAKLNRRIVDLPVRYHERTYGDTNIARWKHGWLLLRMVAFAARRLKFV